MSVDQWSSAPFLDRVRAWVDDAVTARGMKLTGEWEQPHCRPWSSAVRFETTGGRVWFKVSGPGTRFEAALLRLLDEVTPGLAPELLAVDTDRAWSLTRDAGPVLRLLAEPDRIWPQWEQTVRAYAEAQVVLSSRGDRVLGTGVTEVSPRTIPGQARRILGQLSEWPVAQGGLDEAQAHALAAMLPDLDSWCAELSASGVPSSVQHDDLHSSNVCWSDSIETMRIIDWGDTSWGCPLATMLATMNSIARHLGVFEEGRPVEDPRVLRVRDAYLEPFTAYADRADLVGWVDLARRTSAVAKALAYQSALVGEPIVTHAEWEFPVRGWFLALAGG